MTAPPRAVRLRVVASTPAQAERLRDGIVDRGRALGLAGWARSEEPPEVRAHVEGAPDAVDALIAWAANAGGARPGCEPVRVEGHEQFAARGVSAGVFVVQEHQATAHHFDLRLEVDGVMRSWAVPKGPSLDPAARRLAVQVPDHSLAHNDVEGSFDYGTVIVWDRGRYEQGGRVPWPAALERGHAVFVLHGEKLQGGFALQRTRPGARAQWLLIKRRDAFARPGSDIVSEQPHSIVSGRRLADLG